MNDGSVKRLEWGRRALDAFVATLIEIAGEDRRAAGAVEERVDHALALIVRHPGLGTPLSSRNERRFAVPRTGHVIHYRVSASVVRVTRWYRARQSRGI